MLNKILIGVAILVIVSAGAWFISYYPLLSQKSNTPPPAPIQEEKPSSASAQTESVSRPTLTGIPAIKNYASKQFNIPEDKLVVVSSSEEDWSDNCLDLAIPNGKCEKVKTHGFEVTFQINGQNATYRGSEDGTNIRFVKK